MKGMTKKDAIARIQAVVGQRLAATDPAYWNVKGLMAALGGEDTPGTEEVRVGYCTVVVDGTTTVYNDITEMQCSNMGGAFSLTPPGGSGDTSGSGGIG